MKQAANDFTLNPLVVVTNFCLTMDCDRCGKQLKSNHIVNVQRHYESDSCKRKTAEMDLQQSQPPAEKRQRLLCTSAANAEEPVSCNESVAVACEESVAEPNQRLPKPLYTDHILCCIYRMISTNFANGR